MTSLVDLQRAVQETVDSGRIGTPVFARLLLVAPIDADRLLDLLAAGVSLVADWMGSPPARMIGNPGATAETPSLTLVFEQGATALVSAGRGEHGTDLLLLGQHGAVYHEIPTGQPIRYEALPATASDLREEIRAALQADAPNSL